MCINQSAFQKLKRPTVHDFSLFFFFLKPALIYEGVLLLLMSSSPSTLFMTTMKLEAGGVFIKRKLLGGPAPWPVLIWVKSADQTLDALQLIGGVFLCASFWGHWDRAGGHGGGVTGHLRCGIQGDSRHRTGRDNAVPFQLGPAAGHRGHGGGEQGAVRYRHGKGVGVVPESRAHCVQEGVPVNRRGSSRRGCRRRCHVRVRIGEQTAKRRHGNALWRNLETECELQGWW